MKRNNALFLIVVVFSVVMGAASGLWWQMLEAEEIAPIYRSLAKLLVSHPVDPLAGSDAKEANPEIYGSFIDIIESAEMNRRARERLWQKDGDFGDAFAEVRVARTKSSGVLNVLATGNEAKHTQVFLNALLDEFVIFRRSCWEQSMGSRLSARLEEVVTLQQYLEAAQRERDKASSAAPPTDRRQEETRLSARLSSLRDMRDDAALALKLAPANSADPSARARLDTLNAEVKQAEERLSGISAANDSLQAAETAFERARRAYDEAFARASAVKRELDEHVDVVSVLERATAASSYTQDTWPMLLTGLAVGGCIGGVISVPVGFLVTWRPKPKPPPLPGDV